MLKNIDLSSVLTKILFVYYCHFAGYKVCFVVLFNQGDDNYVNRDVRHRN
jgi:hypothetical protein